jgi:hypothetical protein
MDFRFSGNDIFRGTLNNFQIIKMTNRKWGRHMPLPTGLKGGYRGLKIVSEQLQKRIYPKKGKIWNNQGEEKSFFILDFPSPHNLKAQKAFKEKGF